MTQDSVSYTRREIAGVAVATSRFPNAVDEIEGKSNCQLFIIRCTRVVNYSEKNKQAFEEKYVSLLDTYNRKQIIPVAIENYNLDMIFDSDPKN